MYAENQTREGSEERKKCVSQRPFNEEHKSLMSSKEQKKYPRNFTETVRMSLSFCTFSIETSSKVSKITAFKLIVKKIT